MLGAVASVVAAAVLSTLVLGPDTRPSSAAAPDAEAQWWVHQRVRWDMWDCGSGPDGYSEVGSFDLGPVSPSCGARPAPPRYGDRWVRYDGGALATPDESTSDPDDVDVWEGDYQTGWELLSPEDADALVSHLPADPAAALRLIRTRVPPTRFAGTLRLNRARRDFAAVVGLLSTAPDLPRHKAVTLHQIVLSLPGVTAPARVTDGAGRPALAVGVDGAFRDYAGERNTMQVLLDPRTYAYRGVRYVAGLDYRVGGASSGGPYVAAGTVVATATRVTTAPVTAAGDRSPG
ncbi:hypothetical protein ACIQPQ_20130 [Streptomyces sp. NPDC091281]|uniref:hypothetical protein n=1 Tax=Streptomyces sp. NPDC091281 TaxID=3365985 RepID=UPI0037F57947